MLSLEGGGADLNKIVDVEVLSMLPIRGEGVEACSPGKFTNMNALKLNLGHSGGKLLHNSKYHIHENFTLRKGYLIVCYSNPGQPHGG